MRYFQTLDDLRPRGRRVLVRADLNVPMKDGRPSDTTRIDESARTIRELAEKGARVIVLSHFGRPSGQEAVFSQRPLALPLSRALGRPVIWYCETIGSKAQRAVNAMEDGQILLLENTRFDRGEEKNDPGFIKALASLGDAYVNDAFSVSHRAHASTEGLAHVLPAYAGRLMQAELSALDQVLGQPQRPVAAIVGGAKVSTKLDLLLNLIEKVDVLIIAGGMANTFLFAQGAKLGRSLCETGKAESARAILAKAEQVGCRILLPHDGVMAAEFAPNAPSRIGPVTNVPAEMMVLDTGPDSVREIIAALAGCKTLLWNGPLGAFEIPPFDAATLAVAREVAALTRAGKLTSVAGGGDTVAALAAAGVTADLTYVSTAGGAFLEWLEGKELPGVAALNRNTTQAV